MKTIFHFFSTLQAYDGRLEIFRRTTNFWFFCFTITYDGRLEIFRAWPKSPICRPAATPGEWAKAHTCTWNHQSLLILSLSYFFIYWKSTPQQSVHVSLSSYGLFRQPIFGDHRCNASQRPLEHKSFRIQLVLHVAYWLWHHDYA